MGRVDIVENRYVGMKARGCYDAWRHRVAKPIGPISITLDRELHLKDELMPRYAKLIYNGWWSPERRALQALIDQPQDAVTGRVQLKLYKGSVTVVGREGE